MTRTVTAAGIKRIITKGLTGWEAGKLMLQSLIDTHFGRDSVLTEADTITCRPRETVGHWVRCLRPSRALI
jgi:hypothetical protein